MSAPRYGDYQYEIYFDGLEGRLPKYPVDFASLERAAGEVVPAFVFLRGRRLWLRRHPWGDKGAEAASGVSVLGRKQSVIAGQAHTAAQLNRLTQQAGRDPACRRRVRGLGEEDPYMCAATGMRHLQRRRNPIGACGFQVGEGV